MHASQINQGETVAVVSDDTDVFLILLSIASKMYGDLYFRQGKSTVGKGIEYVSSLASYLSEECCRILPGFHALTGSDFIFSLMMNLKKGRCRTTTMHLLETLGTGDVNHDDVTEFIHRTVYNQPRKETTLEESRREMMKVGKGKKKKV